MPDPQEIVIVDAGGTEHVFPAGFDPKKAAGIVRYQTQAHPPSAEDFTEKPAGGTGAMGALSAFGHALDPRPLVGVVADMYRASHGDPFAASRSMDVGKQIVASQGQQFSKAAEDAKQGHYSEMLGHGAAGVLPLVGPAAAHAGERIGSGDVAGGLGESAAVLAPMVAPAAIGAMSRGGKTVAGNLYLRAVKPTKAVLEDAPAFRTGGQAAARTELATTGLKARAPVGTSGVEKVGGQIEDLNQQIADRIAQSDLAGRVIDPTQVASRAQAIKGKFANQVAPQADLNAIDQTITDFMAHPKFGTQGGAASLLSPSDAQAMKQGTYRTLKGKVYGELKSADVEAQKALARGLKEEIATAAPEVGPLNAQESRLISLEKALQDRARTAGNADPFKLGEQVLMAGTHPKSAVMGLINRPGISSRAAIGINDASRVLSGLPGPMRAALLAMLGQEEQP